MEDYVLTTQILTEFELERKEQHKVRAFVIMQEKLQKNYEYDLMGKQVVDYVKETLSNYETSIIKVKDDKQSLVEILAPHIKDEDYIIVLYGDTPLVRSSTIDDALEYATTKGLDYCKLYKGGIFKASAVRSGKIEYLSEANFLSKEDFFCVFDNNSISKARQIMKQRIIEKHIKNNVEFFDISSVYIDSTVDIASNVKIYANNVVKGQTTIASGCILNENNVINNCKIEENCVISSSYLNNTKIKKNSNIGPFKIKE